MLEYPAVAGLAFYLAWADQWRWIVAGRSRTHEPSFSQLLALIGKLYAFEREVKEADYQVRLALRQQRSAPVLAETRDWLDAEGDVVLPRSPMATAITYARNQWQELTTYTTQGFLNIDNNASERALKRVAIGRKNWLFAGNDAAAENHAR